MHRRAILAGVAALLAGAGSAAAQPGSPREQAREAAGEPQPVPEAPEERPITFSVRLGGELGFDADLDDGGDVTLVRARAGASVGIPAGERGQLTIGYDYELSDYDFTDATGLVPGIADPWGTVHSHGLGLTYARRLSLRWSALVGGNIAWSAEEGADLGDSLTGGGFAAGQFAATEKLFIGLGVGVRSRLEDSVLLSPVILLDWTISEQWKLSNEGRPGLTLSYVPAETWTIDLTGAFEFRDFRLDDSGPLPGGVGVDSRVPVSLGVTWTPSPMFTFGARAGAYFFTTLEALDVNGNEAGTSDVDPGPFLVLEGRIRF